jgi:hypothetical protein
LLERDGKAPMLDTVLREINERRMWRAAQRTAYE